jgi:hypothetical protein
MITWAAKQTVDIIFVSLTTIGFPIVPEGGGGNDEREARGASNS